MTHLLKNMSNSIWHAFYALQQDGQMQPGIVSKSKLKVLTANIGTLMDLHGVEKGLDHYRSTSTLNFEQFIYYLQEEVFSSLTDATTRQKYRNLQGGIDEICWLVCHKSYLDRPQAIFRDNSVYQLFRVFCLLAEMEADPMDTSYLVTMHSDELSRVASQLVTSLGLHWDAEDFAALSSSIGRFRFAIFLAVLESKYSGGSSSDIDGLTEAIDDLYETYVEDVIKKGYLGRKGFLLLPSQKCSWYVLRPGELSYYKDSHQKEPCGVISLTTNCWADAVTISGKPDRRFILNMPEQRCVELIAEDHRGRLQWMSALQIAIQHSNKEISYQRSLANQRRSTRQASKQEKEETRLELQQERQARIAAEVQAKELTELSKQELAKVQELEELKQQLEIRLYEEKQALRDEEIVRSLQGRFLREEWEKREKLEILQQEQQELLELEKLKRQEFELKQQDNEQRLRDAELRLEQLEAEKQNLNVELQTAIQKARRAEEAQILLGSQLATTKRTQSFKSTVKERPLVIDNRMMPLQKNC
ncbi:switch-associated protein 70 isoform X2 [Copidosoma floridanum]|uniref:switch-associated protein 70 isoform X2 n=1 Tax=Copidosoma floridanum TaxID=29053 RepID=UPI0006C9ADDB|nr:switch-associated protein 70 isoform X2 [Copidosoma floridanum]